MDGACLDIASDDISFGTDHPSFVLIAYLRGKGAYLNLMTTDLGLLQEPVGPSVNTLPSGSRALPHTKISTKPPCATKKGDYLQQDLPHSLSNTSALFCSEPRVCLLIPAVSSKTTPGVQGLGVLQPQGQCDKTVQCSN